MLKYLIRLSLLLALIPGFYTGLYAKSIDYSKLSREELIAMASGKSMPSQSTTEGGSFPDVNLTTQSGLGASGSFTWQILVNGVNLNLTIGVDEETASATILDSDWFGTETIVFKSTEVADPSNFGLHAVAYEVSPVNDNPTFTLSSATVVRNEDAGIVSIANFLTDISSGNSFEDNAGQTYLLSLDNISNPSHFTTLPNLIVNGNSATLEFRTKPDFFGDYNNIEINIIDSEGGVHTDVFDISILSVNDQPSFDLFGDIVLKPGQVYSQLAFASNFNRGDKLTAGFEVGQTLTFNTFGFNPALFAAIPSINSNGTFTCTVNGLVGSTTVSVSATDNGIPAQTSVVKSFNVIIAEDPVLNGIPDVSVNEIEADGVISSFNLVGDGYLTGGHNNTYSVVGNTNLNVTIDPLTSEVEISAPANWWGVEVLSFKVTTGSPDFKTSNDAIIVTVNNINDNPSFTRGSDINVNFGSYSELWATNITAGPYEGVASGDVLSFSITLDDNTGVVVPPSIDPNTGVLSFQINPLFSKTYTATVTLSDGQGGSYSINHLIIYVDDFQNPDLTFSRVGQTGDEYLNVLPIVFDLTLSEPVNRDVLLSDVNWIGTANINSATLNKNSELNYTLTIDGVSTDGSLMPSIAGGVFTDQASNSSNISSGPAFSVVYDSTDPVLTLSGDNPYTHERTFPFVDPGYSALDNIDGNISLLILRVGSVNDNVVGQYSLTYSVLDRAGNLTTVIRTVNVVDTNPPMMIISSPLESSRVCGDDTVICATDEPGIEYQAKIDSEIYVDIDPAGFDFSSLAGFQSLNVGDSFTLYVRAYDGQNEVIDSKSFVRSTKSNAITSFIFEKNNNDFPIVSDIIGVIVGNDITLTVPHGSAITELKPTITFSPFATIVPQNLQATNFTNSVNYSCTAHNGDVAVYTVYVVVLSNVVPQIISDSNISINEDTQVSISLNDLVVVDSDDLYPDEFSLQINPGANYTVSGSSVTPSLNYNGNLDVITRVYDGTDYSSFYHMNITVNAVNDIPVILSQNEIVFNEDNSYNLSLNDINVSDPDNNTSELTLHVNGGLNYSVVGTMVTPEQDFNGNLSISVYVEDINGGISNNYTLTATVLSVQDQLEITAYNPVDLFPNVFEAQNVIFDVTAIDVDNNPITYTWYLDGTMQLSGVVNNWNWLPDYNSSGMHIVTVSVSNGITTLEVNWSVNVQHVDRELEVDFVSHSSLNGNQWVTENVLIDEEEELLFNIAVLDPDFEYTNNKALDWNFVSNTGNNHTIVLLNSVLASSGVEQLETGDYVGVFYDRQGIDVCAGYSVYTSGSSIGIVAWGDDETTPNKDGFVEGEVMKFKIFNSSSGISSDAVVDFAPEGGVVSATSKYEKDGASELLYIVGLESSSGLTYSWKYDGNVVSNLNYYNLNPLNNTNGFHSLSLHVADIDGKKASVDYTWQITVNDVDFPINVTSLSYANLSSGVWNEIDKEVNEGENLSFSVLADDPDLHPLVYSWKLNGVEQSNTETYQFITGFTSDITSGNYVVALTLSDGEGKNTVSYNWNVVVKDVNQNIVVDSISPAVGVINVNEESADIQFEINAYDPDLVPLNYNWKLNNVDVSNSNQYLFDINYDASGVYELELQVSESAYNETLNYSWSIIVENVDRPIVVNSILPNNGGLVTINETEQIDFAIDAYDPDGNILAYNWKLDGIIVSNISTFTFETDYSSVGNYVLTLDVTDQTKKKFVEKNTLPTYTWQIVVNNLNQNIVVTNLSPNTGNVEIDENESLHLIFEGYDPDGSVLSYSWKVDNVGVSTNSEYVFTTDYNTAGSYTINLEVVENLDNETLNYQWNLTVIDIDQTIIVNSVVPNQGGTLNMLENSMMSFSIDAYDPDGNSLIYKWVLDENTVSTTASWDYFADYNSAGTHLLSLIVNDQFAKSTISYNWLIVVENVDRDIVVVGLSPANKVGEQWITEDQTINEGGSLIFTASAYDPDMSTKLAKDFNWSFTTTENNHMFIIPSASEVTIDGVLAEEGDLIGVFFIDNNQLKCAGYTTYHVGMNNAIVAWGDDLTTVGTKEGFADGETVNVRIFDISANLDLIGVPSYTEPGTGIASDKGMFRADGISEFTKIAGVNVDNTLQYNWFVNNELKHTGNIYTYYPQNNESGLKEVKLVINSDNKSSVTFDWEVTVNDVDFPIVVTDLTPANYVSGIWSPINQVINETEIVSFNVSAYDPDNNPLSIKWNVDGVEVSNEPQYDFISAYLSTDGYDEGNYLVTLDLADGEGKSTYTKTWSVVVNDMNQNLIVNSIVPAQGSYTIDEMEQIDFSIDVVDPDNSNISYSWKLDGVETSITSNYIFVTSYLSAGNYNVLLTVVEDGYNETLNYNWSIQVNNVDQNIVVNSLIPVNNSTIEIFENQDYQFSIDAYDPDNDELVYQWILDDELLNENSASYNYFADYESNGNHTLKLNVTDGSKSKKISKLKNSLSFEWYINVTNVDRPPVAQIENLNDSYPENSLIAFNVIGSDPDGDNIAYDIISGLIEGMNINSDGEFNWFVDYESAGTYNLTIRVSSESSITSGSILYVDLPLEIVITDVDQNIIVSDLSYSENLIGIDQTINETETLNFYIIASDPDNNPLEYEWKLDGAIVSSINTYDFITSYTSSGVYEVVLNVTDNYGTKSSFNANWTVTVNDVDQNIVIEELSFSDASFNPIDQEIVETENLAFFVVAVDPDQNNLDYEWRVGENLVSTDSQYLFETTYDSNDGFAAGNYVVTLMITDNFVSDNQMSTKSIINKEWNVHVLDNDRAPLFTSLPTLNPFNETDLVEFAVIANDPDGDIITYEAGTGFIDGMSINSQTGEFEWQTTYNSAGTYNIEIIAKSFGTELLETSAQLEINVNDVDQNIVITEINPSTGTLDPIDETETINFAVQAHDPDGNNVNFSWYVNNNLVSEISGTQTTFDFVTAYLPENGYSSGSYTIRLVMNDYIIKHKSLKTSRNFAELVWTVDVNNVDQGIVVESTEPSNASIVTILETESTLFKVVANDPDGNDLVYIWKIGDQIVGENSNQYQFETNYDSFGEYVLSVTINDGETTSKKSNRNQVVVSWPINVTENDRVPVAEIVGLTNPYNEGTNVEFSISASDPDQDNVITYEIIQGFETGMELNSTGNFNWSLDFNDAGNYDVVVRVNSFNGNSQSSLHVDLPLTLIVNDVDQNMTVEFFPVENELNINEGIGSFNFEVNAIDPDNNQITYEWYLDLGDGVYQMVGSDDLYSIKSVYNPNDEGLSAGSYKVKVIVSDNFGSKNVDGKEWNLTINNVDRAPVLDSLYDMTESEGNTLEFVLSAIDPDYEDQNLTYSIDDAPAGMVVDSETGNITWSIPMDAYDHMPDGYHLNATVTSVSGYDNTTVMSDTKIVNIYIIDVNDGLAVTVSPEPGVIEIDETEFIEFSATAETNDIAEDLTYKWTLNDRVLDNSENLYKFETNNSSSGEYKLELVVSDNHGLRAFDVPIDSTFTWTIKVKDSFGEHGIVEGTNIMYPGSNDDMFNAIKFNVSKYNNPKISIITVNGKSVKNLEIVGGFAYWTGKDSDGKKVGPGTYLYQFKADGVVKHGFVGVSR
ncbi:MAG: DUF5011 domain-containing protein [Candidatus Delongbacteria bacterium]|nr:DUF5011 domain-containing protein [Candidatus Delongbacteria bacterium]MBN2834638.1 DUF5011 domain-containing protein [Candidatus Delongbacteria bacterium]